MWERERLEDTCQCLSGSLILGARPACHLPEWTTRSVGARPLAFVELLGGRLALSNGPTVTPPTLTRSGRSDNLDDRRWGLPSPEWPSSPSPRSPKKKKGKPPCMPAKGCRVYLKRTAEIRFSGKTFHLSNRGIPATCYRQLQCRWTNPSNDGG